MTPLHANLAYGVWPVAMFVPTTAPARTRELIKATKTAPTSVPSSHVPFPSLVFLRPSFEISNETMAQARANRYGTHIAAAPGINVCSACHAAVIAPVIAAKFVNDWTVMKSLTVGLASVPVEASRGDSAVVVVLKTFITAMWTSCQKCGDLVSVVLPNNVYAVCISSRAPAFFNTS